jgi:hypothetical protein
MSQLNLFKARNTSHEKDFSYLFIHNQSNRGGDLDAETKTVPLGQAGDANAMCLANQHDVLVTSLPFEQSYLDYWTKFLHLTVAQRFVPKKFNTFLEILLIMVQITLPLFEMCEILLIMVQITLPMFEMFEILLIMVQITLPLFEMFEQILLFFFVFGFQFVLNLVLRLLDELLEILHESIHLV